MSKNTLKRPLVKNIYLSLTGNEPVLNNFSLYDHFPIGLMIISYIDPTSCKRKEDSENIKSNENDEMEFKIKYINQKANELLEIKESDSVSKIHEHLKNFKKFENFQSTEETLDNILFNKNRKKDFYGSFKNQASLIYVKYKIYNEDLYICTDYYNDEKKIIQNQLFKSLKFQYIATLFHELYNPINALLFMIDINPNEEENRDRNIRSNLDHKNILSDIEESNFSVISENDCDKINLNMRDEDYVSFNRHSKINDIYKNKLSVIKEKEKDINILVNMIYIFLENLILYLRINLGNNINEKKTENDIIKNENDKSNTKNNNELNLINKENTNKMDNAFTNHYLSYIKKNKKLNLELSFIKNLKKFCYLFKFKEIQYSTNFSYLSNKYILTDETIFLDFLGQIYTFLYYSIPKSQGFELSYRLINDNKLKILFQKTNCPNKGGFRFKKNRKSTIFILCQDKFKATSTVKTSDMTVEILYKLSEVLGIKIKVMEPEDKNENIYLTIILPYFLNDENDILDQFMDIEKNSLENEKSKIINEDECNISIIEKKNIKNNNINMKNYEQNNLKLTHKLSSSSKNNNNPNYYTFNSVVEHIKEEKTSEENLSCNSKEDIKEKDKDKNNNNISKPNINNNNISYTSISKSSLNNPVISIINNSQKFSLNKSKSPMSDKNFSFHNNFKDLSTNYLNEINPSIIQNENNISKDIISKEKKNRLSLIHQKYSNLEKLKKRGVEILTEEENKNENNNTLFYFESIDSNDNKTSIKDKNSIDVEADSDNFIEFENEDEDIDDGSIAYKKNEEKPNRNISHSKGNNTVLLNLNYIYNNGLNPENDIPSPKKIKNKSLFVINKRSNKTLDYNKVSNDSLFVIPEINENFITNNKSFNQIEIPKCNCKDILLVDDDEFILKISKNILKSFKLEADCAENGQECLNMIKEKQEKKCNCSKNKYKLVLMDITMPIMDGIEAAKNIQKMIDENKLYNTIKIIFISAHANLDLTTIFSGIKCAIDYYPKPISGVKYKSLLDKYYFSK